MTGPLIATNTHCYCNLHMQSEIKSSLSRYHLWEHFPIKLTDHPHAVIIHTHENVLIIESNYQIIKGSYRNQILYPQNRRTIDAMTSKVKYINADWFVCLRFETTDSWPLFWVQKWLWEWNILTVGRYLEVTVIPKCNIEWFSSGGVQTDRCM